MVPDKMVRFIDPRTSWLGWLFVSGMALVVIFCVIMPASSSTVDNFWLLPFWTVHVFVALAILQAAQFALSNCPGFVRRASPLTLVSLAGVIGSFLFAPVAFAMDFLFGVAETTNDHNEGLIEGVLDEFGATAPILIILWIVLNAPRLLQLEPLSATKNRPMTREVTLWDKVPDCVGRDLVALSAELHYLRVYTSEGDALVLFPFGQAVRDLSPKFDGVQIHRSHWVVLDKVVAVSSRGQGAQCQLSNGLSLPVSRSRKKDLSAKFD